ncbi:MAG: DNA repair protein RecN [Armatimonadetes bacterium]|nr:DNA repair protein RecN [Armatimonadota bacterium]
MGLLMLRGLTVRDVATIESCSVVFGPGLTVLTGETGAGKSLLVDAIALALGGRADSGLVRAGAAKAVVTLSADVMGSPAVVSVCAENGVEVEDGEIVVQREVSAEGRSTVRINGRLASVGVLRRIGVELVDLHGQHDHQSLLVVERQIEFLDEWVGSAARTLCGEVAGLFVEAEQTRRKLAALRTSRRDTEQRLDMLKFQIEEISSVSPVAGEFEELEARLSRLQHAERLAATASESLVSLADGEGSAVEVLSACVQRVEADSALDPSLGEVLDSLRQALFSLEDGVKALREYGSHIDMEPGALELSAGRLDALRRLRKKYGDDEAAVVTYLQDARAELQLLEDSESSDEELSALLSAQESELHAVAGKLTKLRMKKAREFASTVTGHLRELAMEKAEFEVRISPQPVQPNGADLVEFYFTANPGEPARPLAKVASGGEISRVMLSIKAASAGRAGVPTMIFDEIDLGLSGRAAAVTATKLRDLAEHCQILAITHLPQIAGRCDTHLRIEKSVERGRSVTRVAELEGEERIAEVARLLAGEKVGESALANARELIGLV